MKKIIVLGAMLMCGITPAHAGENSESVCLVLGKLAYAVAEARPNMSEKDINEARASVHKGPRTQEQKENFKIGDRVVSFVYTMQPSPDDARKMVYLKCLAGAFN